MLKSVLVAAGIVAMSSTVALAYDTFIPLGTAYSPTVSSLPEMNSEQDHINLQADIFETEIYMKERDARIHDSYIRRVLSQENSGSDFSIDY